MIDFNLNTNTKELFERTKNQDLKKLETLKVRASTVSSFNVTGACGRLSRQKRRK
jgi:hypothetical protein